MVKSASNGAVFGSIIVAALSSSVAGCASIWGFQDATDEREDATSIDLPDAEAGPPAGPDASVDATVGSMQDASSPYRADAADGATTADAVVGPEAASADATMDAGAADGLGDEPAPCAGSCVPAAPSDWEGPWQISESSSPDAGSLQGCANDSWASVLDLVAGPSADPASCTCTCGPPSGIACGPPSVTYFRDRLCTMDCAVPTPVGSTCTTLSATGCGVTPHFTIGSSSTDGGACAPLATTSLPPIAWSSTAQLCAPAPSVALGACAPAEACVPAPDAATGPSILCVAQQGDAMCPIGYGVRHGPPSAGGGGADGGTHYFAQTNDDRACSTCSCGAPSGAECTISGIVAYSDSACTMPAQTMEADAGCVAMGAYNATCAGATASGGRCTATGGLPTGGVTLTSPYTICCNR